MGTQASSDLLNKRLGHLRNSKTVYMGSVKRTTKEYRLQPIVMKQPETGLMQDTVIQCAACGCNVPIQVWSRKGLSVLRLLWALATLALPAIAYFSFHQVGGEHEQTTNLLFVVVGIISGLWALLCLVKIFSEDGVMNWSGSVHKVFPGTYNLENAVKQAPTPAEAATNSQANKNQEAASYFKIRQ